MDVDAASALLSQPIDEDGGSGDYDLLILVEVAVLVGHTERVWCADWNPAGDVIASCGADKTIRLWSRSPSSIRATSNTNDERGDDAVVARSYCESWGCIRVLDGEHQRTIRHVSWSPSGACLAASSFDATASLWRRISPDGFDMICESILDGHESEVKCIAWGPGEDVVATCSRDRTVWLWDSSRTIMEDDEVLPGTEFECAAVLSGHVQDVKFVRFAPSLEQRVVVSCGYDDSIRVWKESRARSDEWSCSQILTLHTGTVWQVAFQRVVRAPAGPCSSSSSSPPPLLMASCSDDTTVIVWAANTSSSQWKHAATVSGVHTRSIFSTDWSPSVTRKEDGGSSASYLASGGGDNAIAVYRVVALSSRQAQGNPFPTVRAKLVTKNSSAHSLDVNSVRFSGDDIGARNGVRLCSASDDTTVKVWRLVAVPRNVAAK